MIPSTEKVRDDSSNILLIIAVLIHCQPNHLLPDIIIVTKPYGQRLM